MVHKMSPNIHICIASGPSLTEAQVSLIPDSANVICVNDNYRMYPKCSHLFAADGKWWREYYDDVISTVSSDCRLHTTYKTTPRWDRVEQWKTHQSEAQIGSQGLFHGGSSGIMAIELARVLGASKIILLGYDCQITDNKTHWFGDHPKHFSNAGAIRRWPNEFETLDNAYKRLGIDLVNCSLNTALKIKRSTLEEEL